MLYKNPELKSIDLSTYTSELIYELFNSYDLVNKVSIIEDYDHVVLPINKSIPLGLILNEIVTNSIKYVYKVNPKQNGLFFISIKSEGDVITLIAKDSGTGFPADLDFNSKNLSLGIFLIKTLAEQIDGNARFSNDDGAKIELSFSIN
jgi:two-component sensor histidine kinase